MRIDGSPIGGEDAREAAWRTAVADKARPLALHAVRTVTLRFTLELGRRVDVDNLARPALNGLRDAGWFTRGFTSLDTLVVTKSSDGAPGLDVDADVVVPADERAPVLSVASRSQIPTESKPELRRMWCEAVRQTWAKPPIDSDVDVCLSFNTRASLVGLMKVNIDALEPVLGRDPRGRLTWCPLDDKIRRLEVRRIAGDVALLVEVRAALRV